MSLWTKTTATTPESRCAILVWSLGPTFIWHFHSSRQLNTFSLFSHCPSLHLYVLEGKDVPMNVLYNRHLIFYLLNRVFVLQRRGLPLTSFFGDSQAPKSNTRSRSYPRTTGLPHVALNGYPPFDPLLAGLPAAYTRWNPRRTYAADVDSNGRRFRDNDVELDYDGPLTDKDVLPAYDNFGSPPKYADVVPQRPIETRAGSLAVPPAALRSASVSGNVFPERNSAGWAFIILTRLRNYQGQHTKKMLTPICIIIYHNSGEHLDLRFLWSS